LECADLSALWSLATCRQRRRDDRNRRKRWSGVTSRAARLLGCLSGHRTPKGWTTASMR